MEEQSSVSLQFNIETEPLSFFGVVTHFQTSSASKIVNIFKKKEFSILNREKNKRQNRIIFLRAHFCFVLQTHKATFRCQAALLKKLAISQNFVRGRIFSPTCCSTLGFKQQKVSIPDILLPSTDSEPLNAFVMEQVHKSIVTSMTLVFENSLALTTKLVPEFVTEAPWGQLCP